MNEEDRSKLAGRWQVILGEALLEVQILAYQLGLDRGREEAKAHSYNEVINTLCRDLPEGYQIVIECEQGSGQVKLLLPDSDDEIDGHPDTKDFEQRTMELLEWAKRGGPEAPE